MRDVIGTQGARARGIRQRRVLIEQPHSNCPGYPTVCGIRGHTRGSEFQHGSSATVHSTPLRGSALWRRMGTATRKVHGPEPDSQKVAIIMREEHNRQTPWGMIYTQKMYMHEGEKLGSQLHCSKTRGEGSPSRSEDRLAAFSTPLLSLPSSWRTSLRYHSETVIGFKQQVVWLMSSSGTFPKMTIKRTTRGHREYKYIMCRSISRLYRDMLAKKACVLMWHPKLVTHNGWKGFDARDREVKSHKRAWLILVKKNPQQGSYGHYQDPTGYVLSSLTGNVT